MIESPFAFWETTVRIMVAMVADSYIIERMHSLVESELAEDIVGEK